MRNRTIGGITGLLTAVMLGTATLGMNVSAAQPDMQGMQGSQMQGGPGGMQGGQMQGGPGGEQNGQMQGGPGGDQNGQFPGGQGNAEYADEPTEIAQSSMTNTAAALEADEAAAQTITMSDENSQVKISDPGTYIVTGSCSDGNITVKKGTTGVVLILRDLDLTSTTGATVSINKESEVKLVIEGTVKLTDAEDPADEDSEDADVADAFDGAAIKVKDGANAYITGTGTLIIDASACKNGIKSKDDAATSLVIDGPVININAANDAINAGYDLTILSGTITIAAGDDGIHSDRILTVGKDGSGPEITITTCCEGLEGTVVNIFGGNINVTASDDGINAANSDGTYSEELDFSINITAGTVSVNCQGDGLDSNGNINLVGGTITIKSASAGGEAGMDYDGSCYVSDSVTLNNASGVAGPDGGPGNMPGGQGNMPEGQGNVPGQEGNEQGEQPGNVQGQQMNPQDGRDNIPERQGNTQNGEQGIPAEPRRIAADETDDAAEVQTTDASTVEGFVRRLYRVVLGREADKAGLASWVSRLESGTATGADAVSGFYLSSEISAKALSNGEYVDLVYEGVLGREADDAGREYWTGALDAGVSRGEILRGFTGSNEFGSMCRACGIASGSSASGSGSNGNIGITLFVSRLYTEVLGRTYDAEGLNYWTERILSDTSKANILNVATVGFLQSEEFTNRGLSDSEKTEILYRAFLGRASDSEGMEYWLEKLSSGTEFSQVAAGFAGSDEFAEIMAGYGL